MALVVVCVVVASALERMTQNQNYNYQVVFNNEQGQTKDTFSKKSYLWNKTKRMHNIGPFALYLRSFFLLCFLLRYFVSKTQMAVATRILWNVQERIGEMATNSEVLYC